MNNTNTTIMKTVSSTLQFIIGLMLLCSSSILSSCEWMWDEDGAIAYDIEGTWEGDMYFSYSYNGREYYSNYTQIEFLRNGGYRSGRGFWIDYYSNAPWDYVANHFTWTVEYNTIYIHLEEDNYNIEIRDYSLDDNYFWGKVYYEGEHRSFKLRHTSSPNWNDYDYGWGYDYYYSQRRATDADSSVPRSLRPLPERPHFFLRPEAK